MRQQGGSRPGTRLDHSHGRAEDKENTPATLRRFLALAGGRDADIVVIPTASQLADTGTRYEPIFPGLGAARATALDFDTRRDAEEPGRLTRLRKATGVFMTGGSQLRLSALVGGTPIVKALRVLNAAGMPVAGTSAGAAFISEHMIAFGDEGSTPVAGCVRPAPGLGLTNRFIIDQHFRQRDRLGRLLTALAYNPFAVGIGLDEHTAAFIAPANTVHVEGSGGITVVDASGVEFSSMDSIDEGRPVCLPGIQLHVLTQGSTFTCPSPVTCSCCGARNPLPGLSPQGCPRLQSRWFNGLLRASSTLRAVRTLDTQRPRVVKRRNSPYAPQQRDGPARPLRDFTPTITALTGRRPPPPRPPPPAPPPHDEGHFAGLFPERTVFRP